MSRVPAPGWYRSRPDRERLAMRVVAFAAVALLALWGWVENERARARLQQQLPQLRASIASLERAAEEVKRLRAMPPAAAADAGAPLASLASNAGGVPGAQITVLDERRVRLTGADVALASLLDWLAGARATHGVRVESARLERLPAPGRVRAELVVSRS